MSTHHHIVKAQLLHMLLSTAIFVVLGGIAVALDLAAERVLALGVSRITYLAIDISAHVLLAIDLMLFGLHQVRSSYGLVREMLRAG